MEQRAKFQVALSYAEEDQAHVAQVSEELSKLGVTFLDTLTSTEMLGRHSPTEIRSLFANDVEHAILFISETYVNSDSTKAQRRAAIDRALTVDGFALPVRLDDSAVPGLSENIGYLRLANDGRDGLSPSDFALRVLDWLSDQDSRRNKQDRGTAIAGSGPTLVTAWAEFDPSSLHFLVIESESEAPTGRGKLAELFDQILGGDAGEQVWRAARGALHNTNILAGARRFADYYALENVKVAHFSVADALRSPESLADAVRLIVQADLTLFDVTNFEPGVMMLLGVRAATRRGVTITSHGGGWIEGTPLPRPFNLSDLSLASHSSTVPERAGDDPQVGRMADRIVAGFRQLKHLAGYHDLPVYDALRQADSDPSAWAPIPLKKATDPSGVPVQQEVLVLCTYAESFQQLWMMLKAAIVRELVTRRIASVRVIRMQDIATPEVVSQALYARIRRCVACLVDWTNASPSTFFELGVRLVVSPWGTAQTISKDWSDKLSGATGMVADQGIRVPPPNQTRGMRALFSPREYSKPISADEAAAIVADLIHVSESRAQSGHLIRRVAIDALTMVEPRIRDVATELQAQADGLDSLDQQSSLPRSLFYESAAIKLDRERAARERRVAAWLYLHHRLEVEEASEPDNPSRKHWREFGDEVVQSLLQSDDGADKDLGLRISNMLEQQE